MTLITRIARLFRADLHAVLDRIEEPDALLRQAIREMEEELDRDEAKLRALVAELNRLADREAESRQSLDAIDGEIDLCFEAGQEDLARSLVKRKLEIGRGIEAAAKQRAGCEAARAELQARIEENRALLDATRAKAEALVGGIRTAQAFQTSPAQDEVEVAFLREKQKRGRP